ncbi:hypothetical protein [Sphingobacterium siyangense]|uniref:Uncharacterized protein n=1 Tax=Sphingobacterium siyangense TaxID=459529 RepID=A0A562MQQ3_9SPHI|nr:hypothetical protein [Sphingobacterium siyangense]TWI22180.1 hypothetical protein IQ31_01585 [Sphingobacterium siyangense]
MKQVYKLTSKKLEGCLYVTFDQGYLTAIEIAIKSPLNDGQFRGLMINIPYAEEQIASKSNQIGLTCEKIVEMATNRKVAMFCLMYEKCNRIKYKASRQDGGKISSIKITEEILKHYFESENFLFKGKHSISNLVRYYNELLLEISKKGTVGFPNSWSKDYADKLSPADLSEYWKHLRGLGLKPKKDRLGNTTDWIK